MVVTVSTMNETIVTVVSLSDLISSFECDELPQYQFFLFSCFQKRHRSKAQTPFFVLTFCRDVEVL